MTLAFDESSRPRATPQPEASISPTGKASQQALVQIHDHLRHELDQLSATVDSVTQGKHTVGSARSLIHRLTMRQNYWSLGAFCASYCRVVSIHHTIEDERMFVELAAGDNSLQPVLDRLGEEHEAIAAELDTLDAALVRMVADESAITDVRDAVARLRTMLLSHLDYEEGELLGPIGRLSLAI